MKKLMMTTAIVAATSFGALAQTAPVTEPNVTATAPAATAGAHVPAFRASTFTGMNLYAVDAESVRALDADVGVDRSARWTSGATFSAERDAWENIGSISDLVLTQDGELRGVLIDVGGFLGFGARTVMVSIEELYFVADEATPEDLDDFFVVASLSREQLEALPEWNDDELRVGFEPRDYSYDPVTTGVDTAAVDQPVVPGVTPGTTTTAPEDLAVNAVAPTADELLGATVYDAAGDSIGSINDLVLAGDSEVSSAIIDIGGFLGMGTHTIALSVDELNVVSDADGSNVRVEVNMTREQLEALPEHQS